MHPVVNTLLRAFPACGPTTRRRSSEAEAPATVRQRKASRYCTLANRQACSSGTASPTQPRAASVSPAKTGTPVLAASSCTRWAAMPWHSMASSSRPTPARCLQSEARHPAPHGGRRLTCAPSAAAARSNKFASGVARSSTRTQKCRSTKADARRPDRDRRFTRGSHTATRRRLDRSGHCKGVDGRFLRCLHPTTP